MKSFRSIVLVCFAVSFINCNETVTDNVPPNVQPRTFLWLYPDSTVGVGISRQRLRWWGEDPDGTIRGYLFAFGIFSSRITAIPNPDTLRYTWVTGNDTLMAFPLDTLFRNYTVFVRAVDNTFRGLPNGSIVRYQNGPYWDMNDSRAYDGSDVRLTDLASASDSKGAIQTFPVRNTVPGIAFARNPNDANLPLKQPDTTYTVATFAFKGSDFDGDNTLASYRIALNDTTNPASWVTVGLRDTILTIAVPRIRSDAKQPGDTVTADLYAGAFNGRRRLQNVPGLRLNAANKFFVQAKDAAGEFSAAAVLPSGTDVWYVKKPLSRILLVSDYITTPFDNPIPSYLASLSNVGSQFATIDLLDIGRGLTNSTKSDGRFGSLVPPFVDPALIHTFLLFDYVVWFTDRFPSLGVAQLSLFPYLQQQQPTPHRVIFSTNFLNSTDSRGALRDFAPIDSIDTEQLPPPTISRGASTIAANTAMIPDSSVAGNTYPQLAFNSTPAIHSVFMRPIYRRSDARYIYRLAPDAARYIGSPNVGVVDGQRTIVFLGVPLHLLNNTTVGNPEGVTGFFKKVFLQEFSERPQSGVRKRQ